MKLELKISKSDKEYLEFKISKLEDESNAKNDYYNIFNKLLEAGCNPSMPNAYFKPEDLEALKVYGREGLY